MARLKELKGIHKLVATAGGLVRAETLGEAETPHGRRFPILGLTIGAEDRSLPTLGLFAGVHGLERVGTQVLLAYLFSLVERLQWDRHELRRLEACRLVSIPLVNPAGMFLRRRSNPDGVDLMRNAPVEARERPPWLLGGHRISPRLPWFRGAEGAPMASEARVLVEFVERELFQAEAALALDLHSGFGMRDRLWYPYAGTRGDFPRAEEAQNLAELLERTYPQHTYRVEPQAESYTTHGDLWDHLFDRHREVGRTDAVFIPWTLEMGSWNWVRKNPRQLFNTEGPFNPMVPRRLKRAQRRHLVLADFFLRAAHNHPAWTGRDPLQARLPLWS